MDLIYSHAKVTIIAAAGKDPSYGLPGVSRNSFEKVYTEPLNSNWALKTELPPLFSCFITSNWFLRAWTLQEGILSKRKLCFTDYGVLFLCNSNTTGNTCLECESFKDHAKKYKQLSIPMESAMNGIIPNNILEAQTSEEKLSIIKVFLDAYSQRELTYESDSLNALLGAFNFIRRRDPPVYHLWGVAFTKDTFLSSSDTQNEVMISLDWFPKRKVSRRPEFPSWSTLGWRGAIGYWDGHHIKLSHDFSIRYWDRGTYRHLDETFHEPEYAIRTNETPQSQVLEITAHVMDLTVYEEKSLTHSLYYVKFPFLKLIPDLVRRDYQLDIPVDEANTLLRWNDCTGLSHRPSILCCTTRYRDIDHNDFSKELASRLLLLFFRKVGDDYERIAMWSPYTEIYLGVELDDEKRPFYFEDGVREGWLSVDLDAYALAFAERRTFHVR